MIVTEYNEELHNRTLREEGRIEGHDELVRAMNYLLSTNRKEELQRLALDKAFREQIINELE